MGMRRVGTNINSKTGNLIGAMADGEFIYGAFE